MLNSLADVEILDGDQHIGEGAFSVVFRCRLKADSQVYALKVIDTKNLSSADRANLRLEIKLHTELKHNNIISYYDALQIDSKVYILLEYAPKATFFYYIHPQRGLDEHLALRFLYQTALGVKYLHDRQIAHRDIKPENILLGETFEAKLCDFGWSCHLKGEDDARWSICGTYEYMSPEIVNEKPHGLKVDIWCLGILTFEMLNGTPPFQANSMEELRQELRTKRIPISTRWSLETRRLMIAMLTVEADKRIDIDGVLGHPAIATRIPEFEAPLTEEDHRVLMQNYFVNSRNQDFELLHQIDHLIYRGQNPGDGAVARQSEEIAALELHQPCTEDPKVDASPPENGEKQLKEEVREEHQRIESLQEQSNLSDPPLTFETPLSAFSPAAEIQSQKIADQHFPVDLSPDGAPQTYHPALSLTARRDTGRLKTEPLSKSSLELNHESLPVRSHTSFWQKKSNQAFENNPSIGNFSLKPSQLMRGGLKPGEGKEKTKPTKIFLSQYSTIMKAWKMESPEPLRAAELAERKSVAMPRTFTPHSKLGSRNSSGIEHPRVCDYKSEDQPQLSEKKVIFAASVQKSIISTNLRRVSFLELQQGNLRAVRDAQPSNQLPPNSQRVLQLESNEQPLLRRETFPKRRTCKVSEPLSRRTLRINLQSFDRSSLA